MFMGYPTGWPAIRRPSISPILHDLLSLYFVERF